MPTASAKAMSNKLWSTKAGSCRIFAVQSYTVTLEREVIFDNVNIDRLSVDQEQNKIFSPTNEQEKTTNQARNAKRIRK